MKSIDYKYIREISKKRLHHLGVPLHPFIPLLNCHGERTRCDIAKRMIITYSLIGIIYDADCKYLLEWLTAHDIYEFLQPGDIRYLKQQNLTKQDYIDIEWFEECLGYFAWCTKIKNEELSLEKPINIENIFELIPPRVSVGDFVKKIHCRDTLELLEELDFYYLMHAALKHPELWITDKIKDFSIDIVISRRHVLEWIFQPRVKWYDIELNT